MRSSNTTCSGRFSEAKANGHAGGAPAWFWPALVALVYGLAYLSWYWQTPLGRFPVLDERENLDLAVAIAKGALPHEPFYRAVGYPCLLALLPALGVPAAALPFAATGLGLLLHVANSALVALLARRVFGSNPAAMIAGCVHALHPVLLFYATQILDGALANTLILLGLIALVGPAAGGKPAPAIRQAAAAGLAWSLAALTRPQLLLLLPALPLAWILIRGKLAASSLASMAATAAVPWVILGLAQTRVCGEFRLMPTQGAYNLWAANRPGADGRYFTQSVFLPPGAVHENPTRHETLVLFSRETGTPLAEATLERANRHWRHRLIDSLREKPGEWLRLMGRKTVYLFADHDPYNNKTYAFHRDRSPWLRPNPLGWAALLTSAPLAILLLLQANEGGRRLAAGFLVVAAALVSGLLITYVSGRFRIPLTALLCAAAGAWALAPRLGKWPRLHALLGGLCLAALSLGNPLGARDERTFTQDRLLVASSCERAGDDRTTWNEAGLVLEDIPAHPAALGFRMTSGFNLLIAGESSPREEQTWAEEAKLLLAGADAPPRLRTLAALALWRNGERDAAIALWTGLAATDPEAEAALALASASPSPPTDARRPAAGALSLLREAETSASPTPEQVRLRALARKLFGG